MKSMLNSLRRSLSARLLLLFAVASMLIVCLLIGSLVHGIGSQWRTAIAPHLEQYLSYVNSEIGEPPNPQNATQLAARLPIDIYIKGPDTNFSTNGSTLDVTDLDFRETRHRRRHQANHQNIAFGEHRDRTVLRVEAGDYNVYYELRHTRPRAQHNRAILTSLFILTTILAGCYLMLRRMLRPVKDIKQGVRRMGSGQLDTRVIVRADNDLGELAGSINSMAEDIELMLDAKRQLLLGASHELRSPLTRAKIAVQMLEPSDNQSRIADDLDEMESLIAGIMDSEKMKGGHAVLNRIPVDVDELIRSVLGELHNPDVVQKLSADKELVEVDEVRVGILIRNLINNALDHGGGEKPPVIRTSNSANELVISLQDFGKGIAVQDLDKVTEPFYRADPSRARATGGFGLGLHLCQLIARAHGGELTIASEVENGTLVTVKIPV